MADQIMAEGKAKKPGLFRRILWWLLVILLTALLVLGFVFAAPWKVITLIAIFLAAATILPRIYRKWFWLGVGIVVLAITVWIFLPDDNKGWKPYQFDKELAQLQARYAVPDSENAAITYNKILADWKQKEANEPNLPDDWPNLVKYGPWSSKDQPEIAAYIQYHRDTIDKLVQASRFERCSFPIIADVFFMGNQWDRPPAMRQWGYLLIAAGNNDIAERNTNEAIEKYIVVLRMGKHLCQQPIVIDKLVGQALESLGLASFKRLVVSSENIAEADLNLIEKAIESLGTDTNKNDEIEIEKLTVKNMWGGIFYQINKDGQIRLSHDFSGKQREPAKKLLEDCNTINSEQRNFFGRIVRSNYWMRIFNKVNVIRFWFFAPSEPEKLGNIIDAAYEKQLHKIQTENNQPIDTTVSLMRYSIRLNYKKMAETYARLTIQMGRDLDDLHKRWLADEQGCRIIIAIRRYKNTNGNWPEKLEDIKNLAPAEIFVDPMNGDSFVYKRTDDSFTFYSKGPNGIDEEGKREKIAFPDENNVLNKGCDDWMIWPIKNKITKQQEQKTEN